MISFSLSPPAQCFSARSGAAPPPAARVMYVLPTIVGCTLTQRHSGFSLSSRMPSGPDLPQKHLSSKVQAQTDIYILVSTTAPASFPYTTLPICLHETLTYLSILHVYNVMNLAPHIFVLRQIKPNLRDIKRRLLYNINPKVFKWKNCCIAAPLKDF